MSELDDLVLRVAELERRSLREFSDRLRLELESIRRAILDLERQLAAVTAERNQAQSESAAIVAEAKWELTRRVAIERQFSELQNYLAAMIAERDEARAELAALRKVRDALLHYRDDYTMPNLMEVDEALDAAERWK